MTSTRAELDTSWKPKVLVIGATVGAVVGLATAYLLARASEENRGGPPEIGTGDALRLAISVFGLVRGIAALGE